MGVTMAEEAGSVLNQEMTPRASRFYCIVDQQTSWVGRIPILIFALQKWFPEYLWSVSMKFSILFGTLQVPRPLP